MPPMPEPMTTPTSSAFSSVIVEARIVERLLRGPIAKWTKRSLRRTSLRSIY